MSWAHYLLQVNIYLVVFYTFYKLLLDKETYFMWNRIYLLTAGLFSMSIPFIQLEWLLQQPATQQIGKGVQQINMLMEVVIVPNDTAMFSTGNLLAIFYLIGTLFFLFRFIKQLFQLRKLINHTGAGHAFSFFNKKIIDRSLSGVEMIERHEDVHIRQLHTLDVIIFELLSIINWFNPIVYLFKTEIKTVHEYLADQSAAGDEENRESYAMLLLSKAFGIDHHVLTNNFFNQSLLKNRIMMLHKKPSAKAAIFKYGLSLPLLITALLLSSASYSQDKDKPKNESAAEDQKGGIFYNSFSLDSPPSFPGGMDQFYAYLAKHVKYPELAVKNNIQGRIFLSFIIEKNGTLTNIKIERGLGSGLDEEAIRVMKASPNWIAGSHKGVILRVQFNIPISFHLPSDKDSKKKLPSALAPKTPSVLPVLPAKG